MPILLILFALIAPRVLIVLLWLFTGWFAGIFATVVWPVLGFLFLPLTLLWYTAVIRWFGGQWDWWHVLILLLAVAADLGTGGNASRR